MQAISSGKLLVCLVLALTMIVAVPVCQSQPITTTSAPSLDKHARKIHKRLAKYPAGTYISFVLRDGSSSAGALRTLSDASFTIANADNNVPETHFYGDVSNVVRGKEYIGEGSEPGHHLHLWKPVVFGVVAAGAAVTALEVR